MFGAKPPPTVRLLPKRSAAIASAALALALVVAGCGSSGRTAGGANAPDTIVIRDFAFQPSTLVVAPGAKVTVRNEDPAAHTVTEAGATKTFETADIAAGATATFTAPRSAGSYSYICEIHQFMHGTLQVR